MRSKKTSAEEQYRLIMTGSGKAYMSCTFGRHASSITIQSIYHFLIY